MDTQQDAEPDGTNNNSQMKVEPQVILKYCLNPQEPVAQKTADEVVFRRFQGEGVEFFLNRTSLTPLRFLMRIFWKIQI